MNTSDRILKHLRPDQPMIAVTLRMPSDVVDDLKRVAPAMGHSGYQPLIRAYVGRGLREDLGRLEGPDLEALVAELRGRGLDDDSLAEVTAAIKRRIRIR